MCQERKFKWDIYLDMKMDRHIKEVTESQYMVLLVPWTCPRAQNLQKWRIFVMKLVDDNPQFQLNIL